MTSYSAETAEPEVSRFVYRLRLRNIDNSVKFRLVLLLLSVHEFLCFFSLLRRVDVCMCFSRPIARIINK